MVAALLLLGLSAVNVYRAETQSITIDEAHTYNRFVATPLRAMHRDYDANNHVLYTLLAKVSVGLFGPSELTLRLPSLLGGLIYFVGLFVVSRRLFGQGGWFLLSIALNSLNPFLLDYLSAARGYGIALGFWTWALYLLLRSSSLAAFAGAGLLMALSITANLVFLVPCAALAFSSLVISGVRGAARQMLRQAALLGMVVLSLAGPILWYALRMAKREHFYAGAPTAREAINTLAENSLFYAGTWLNWHPVTGPLLRGAPYWVVIVSLVVLLGISAAWVCNSTRRRLPGDFPLLAGTLFGSVMLLAVLRKGFGVLYPGGRQGLYFPLLLSFACLLVLSRLYSSGILGRISAMFAVLPLLFLVVQFVLEFNTTYYFENRFDAGTKGIVERLNRTRLAQEKVRVGAVPFLLHSFEFYQKAYRYDWLQPSGFDGPTCLFDYYALLPGDRDLLFAKYRLTQVYYDDNSGAILAKPSPSALPDLEELAQFGFTDPIPCNVDFNKLGPVVDTRQPGVESHYLRDIVGAPGPRNTIWLASKPALLFRLPDAKHNTLKMDFLTHNLGLGSTGQQTLTIKVNGKLLDRIDFRTEGFRTYRKPVPPEWLRPGGVTLLEIESDNYYVSPLDGQKLSFLASRVEFAAE